MGWMLWLDPLRLASAFILYIHVLVPDGWSREKQTHLKLAESISLKNNSRNLKFIGN